MKLKKLDLSWNAPFPEFLINLPRLTRKMKLFHARVNQLGLHGGRYVKLNGVMYGKSIIIHNQNVISFHNNLGILVFTILMRLQASASTANCDKLFNWSKCHR